MVTKHMMTAVTLAGLVILGAGCFPATSDPSETNTSVAANTSVTTNSATTGSFDTTSTTSSVTFSSSGITPKTLTVAKGTTVVFTNSDSVTHEVASNPHPTHTILPGLQGTASAGSTYSFTFNQAGSFGYHDHLDPFNTKWQGIVVVQ